MTNERSRKTVGYQAGLKRKEYKLVLPRKIGRRREQMWMNIFIFHIKESVIPV